MTEEAILTGMAERLGYEFKDPRLLVQALTHTSFANEHTAAKPDNQRLEFLGDAVLGLVVAETLMERLPEADEGELTPRRAAVVNEASLAGLALASGLGDFLRLGRGEEMHGGRSRPSNLADAFEAVVGAIHTDAGYETAREIVRRWIAPLLDQALCAGMQGDVKTALQERAQAMGSQALQYKLVAEEGPAHDRVFEVEISLGEKALGRGRGRSKKEAEKTAACRALETLASSCAGKDEPEEDSSR